MLSFMLSSMLIASAVAFADVPPLNCTAGFNSPVTGPSTGGGASCISGSIQAAVTSNNIRLLYSGPADQLSATETIQELLQANPRSILGDVNPIRGTYNIYAKLCLPSNPSTARSVRTVQFLTHGDTSDSTYWDIAPGYSYVDAAAKAGYATLSYDRIGVGQSEHPDPVQVVQGPIQVEIAHFLVTQLRKGAFGGYSFKNFIGVGHSAGSTVTQGQTTKYPKDFDAIILTSISTVATYIAPSLASFNLIIANTDPSGKFRGIANGYLTQANQEGIQFSFFRYPNFDPRLLTNRVAAKQTSTIGELFTLRNMISPSPQFTGPVDVVLGQNDYFFCGGDCKYPSDQSAAVVPAFYPAAGKGSQHYLVPGAGHLINAHVSAPQGFDQMTAFLRRNGFT